jgi:outer membrane murein-binding lipoprotein Lpp
MSMTDAKDLHADITRLLLDMETLRTSAAVAKKDEVITLQVGGGSF